MKKFLLLSLIAVMVLSFMVVPAEARRCHRSTEQYVENPRMEAGIGLDLVYNVNDTFAVMSENRLDINNSAITGNTNDWEHNGFSTYLVGVVQIDNLFKK